MSPESPLSPKKLERVKEILDEALKLDPAERRAFVAQACGGADGVRREVESLLEQAFDTAFLDKPFFSLRRDDLTPDGDGTLAAGQHIGPYQVVRLLGQGGMGTVALAVREDDFEKQVALKVIRQGLAHDEVVRRFHNERQILARLDHPNIARILDGGTLDDGRPYFVMEYVDGRSIDEYCDREALSVEARLRLFLHVCSALQVAHQNLVVHRDLKPGNILVTADGTPKLLDFGIAKQLAPSRTTTLTRLTRPMTLHYASPEQIAGRPVTTVSDVYALGVLLYQLLTGRSPYERHAESDIDLARAICDEEPRRPSTMVRELTSEDTRRLREAEPERLRRHLSGDLDSIVLKALRKPEQQRYGSVEQMADDLRRHLDGRPVQARDGTFAYLAGKFVRRHKVPFTAVSALVLLSLVFALTATFLWQRAERARQRSEVAVEFLQEVIRDTNPSATGETNMTALQLLRHAGERIWEIDDRRLQAELAKTLSKVQVDLGLFDEAWNLTSRALDILGTSYPEEREEIAKDLNGLGALCNRMGRYQQAEQYLRQALDTLRQVRPADADLPKFLNNLGNALMYQGKVAEAEEHYREALQLRLRVSGPKDGLFTKILRNLGNLFYVRGDFEAAEKAIQKSLDLRLQLYGPEYVQLTFVYASLGRVRQAQERYEEAEELYKRALRIRRARYGERHRYTTDSRVELASLFLDVGEAATAEVLLSQALGELYRSYDPGHWKLARAESLLGFLRALEGRFEEAEPCLCQAYCALVKARGEDLIHARQARRRLESWRSSADIPAETCECGP